MDLKLFGLATCDTCRKARSFLDRAGLPHRFHDVRTDGLDRELLEAWAATVGWPKLLNRASTTWRGLSADQQALVVDQDSALELMLQHPTLVKRPVMDANGTISVGFNENTWRSRLSFE